MRHPGLDKNAPTRQHFVESIEWRFDNTRSGRQNDEKRYVYTFFRHSKRRRNERGIVTLGIRNFLLDENSLNL